MLRSNSKSLGGIMFRIHWRWGTIYRCSQASRRADSLDQSKRPVTGSTFCRSVQSSPCAVNWPLSFPRTPSGSRLLPRIVDRGTV